MGNRAMSARNSGFTLRDLFVATAVVAALMGMLVVALKSGPTPARRSQCLSNVQQFGLAALMYEQSHRHYPGYYDRVGGKKVSWLVPLMPQIERMDLYRIWS